MNKIKIAATTPMWKRHHVFQIWCDAINRLRNDVKEVELIPIAVGSEGAKSRAICEKNDIIYAEHPNQDLAGKFNKRLDVAREYEPDGLLMLGSDDIISIDTLRFYVDLIRQGYEVIQAYDIYYWRTHDRTAWYCCGYLGSRKGIPLAPGRYLDRKVLDGVGWKIWRDEDGRKKMMDGSTKQATLKSRYKTYNYWLSKKGLFILDIKCQENMTPLVKRKNNKMIDKNILYKHLPKKEADKICAV